MGRAPATVAASQTERLLHITSARLASGEGSWLVSSGPEPGLRHTEQLSARGRRQKPAVTPGRLRKTLVALSGLVGRLARCGHQHNRLVLSPPSRLPKGYPRSSRAGGGGGVSRTLRGRTTRGWELGEGARCAGGAESRSGRGRGRGGGSGGGSWREARPRRVGRARSPSEVRPPIGLLTWRGLSPPRCWRAKKLGPHFSLGELYQNNILPDDHCIPTSRRIDGHSQHKERR
jgi:hypothetical protein